MFACSTRFDNLHVEQVRVVFEALTIRYAELRVHMEFIRASKSDAEWAAYRTCRVMAQYRSEMKLIQGAAVALFGVHILKRDEFWILPELIEEPNFVVAG